MKQYDFLIHGGVNGFSRKNLWLKVVRSNKNPIVPAALYLRAKKEQGLCPNVLKTNCGSETCDIAAVHCFLTGSNHCVKSVQILRKSVQILSPNAGKYGPEKTLYLDTFHTVNLFHRYGASNANQRIENWWSHFKRSFSSWVIDYFKQPVREGIFVPGNVVHVECI